MDWILKTKFTHWLIVGLVVLNLFTLGFIWMQATNSFPLHAKADGLRRSGSLELMKQTLDLSDDQARLFQQQQALHMGKLGANNDQLDQKKRLLAEEVFAANSDTLTAHALSVEIGERESQVEMQRFLYFRDLWAACTPDQREKMKPIVMEVLGKLSPAGNGGSGAQTRDSRPTHPPQGMHRDDARGANGNARPEDHPNPPSVDEKLARLTQRLDLSAAQVQHVKAILLAAQHKNDELRSRPHPNRDEIETAKDRIRKEEDASIMNILGPDQKNTYTHMMENRKK